MRLKIRIQVGVIALFAMMASVYPAAAASEKAVALAETETETDAENENGGEAKTDGEAADSGESGEGGESGGEEPKKHAGGEVHDDKDLSHQDVSDILYDPADIRFQLTVFTFIVFLLLMGVLMKFAWGPITEGLDKREQGIARKIDEAARGAEAASARLAEYDAKLAGAASEAQAIIAKAQSVAEGHAARIRQEAENDAEQQKQRARGDIEAARSVALDELSNRSVDLAVRLAGDIVGRELKQDDHAALIQNALKQFSSSS